MSRPDSPARGDRTEHADWTVRPVSARANKEWKAAVDTFPELMAAERDRLRTAPTVRTNPRRTHRLQGQLATKNIGGQRLPQWQHEITGAGRIWYCPDKQARTIWVVRVTLTHPKETD